MKLIARSAAAGRTFCIGFDAAGFHAEAGGARFATSSTLTGLFAFLDAEHQAVLPFSAVEAAQADCGPTPEQVHQRQALVENRRRRLARLESLDAPAGVRDGLRLELEAAIADAAALHVPRRGGYVPVRLDGPPPPGEPEVGVWAGDNGRLLVQRPNRMSFLHLPFAVPGAGSEPPLRRDFPPSAWPLRDVWTDGHPSFARRVAIFGDLPRWGLDRDGARVLHGVAMLDLDAGEWLDTVPERMHLFEVAFPAVMPDGTLACFHAGTGIVDVLDGSGAVVSWDPLWRADGEGAGGFGMSGSGFRAVVPRFDPVIFDVGGPGAARPRRGGAGTRHGEIVVIGRDGTMATTRPHTPLPRLAGDLVAIGFSPVFDAPVVMTSVDVRFLRWDRDEDGLEAMPQLSIGATVEI